MLITIKIIIVACLFFMVYNLFRALFIMNKGPQKNTKSETEKNTPSQSSMSTFIGRRVMFSALIIMFIFVLILTGVITPNPRPM